MQEPIEDSGGERGVAEALVPVVDDPIRCDDAAAPRRIPSMQYRLKFVGRLGRDFPPKEQMQDFG